MKITALFPLIVLFAAVALGQFEAEKYVGQYQVTGSPMSITVTAKDGKLAIQATDQPKLEIELVAGELYSVKGTAIKLTFQKDAAGKVTGMMVHQAPGVDVPATKMNSSAEEPRDKSPHKSSTVKANGIKMHYLDWGGTGDVIIMLTGFGSVAHVFDDLAPHFTDKYRVIALTRRGFGETDLTASGYDTATRVADIRAFMDAIGIKQANFVGHSLAGDEMTVLASLYPDRIKKLVYLDAAYDRTNEITCNDDQPGGSGPPFFKRIFAEALDCPGWRDIVVPDMPSPELYNMFLSTMKSAARFKPDYRKIKAPALALYADVDLPQSAGPLDPQTKKKLDIWWKEKQVPISRKSINQFRKEMKNGEIVEIKGSGHLIFTEPFTLQVVKLTRDFLAK